MNDLEVTNGDALLPPCTPKQRVFAARRALGDTMTAATRHVGIERGTGYDWEALPQVKLEIERQTREVARSARTMLTGSVRKAVRTVVRLMHDASHKGAPTELAAAKLVLDIVRLGELAPVEQGQRRLLTFIPRDGASVEEDAEETLDVIEAHYRAGDLEPQALADGLPADFPRDQDGDPRFARPEPRVPAELKDPATYQTGRRSQYWDDERG
jgi:hypothetical protein